MYTVGENCSKIHRAKIYLQHFISYHTTKITKRIIVSWNDLVQAFKSLCYRYPDGE